MASELPPRVEPIPGADVAVFPWGEAATALTAIDHAVATLGTQLESRSSMLPAIGDWAGAFREEFDRTYSQLTATAGGLKETLANLASSIVRGAETANAAQLIKNQMERNRQEHERQEQLRQQQAQQAQPTP
jgi:uncharacterized protein YukE